MREVGGIIDECGEMNLIAPRETLKKPP